MISSFDLNKLNSLLQDFYNMTKIRITIFDDSFHELAAYPTLIPRFCQIIRSDHDGMLECHNCDVHACTVVAKYRSLYTYRCHAGLTESITPIIIGNIIIGYLLFGHVFSYCSHEEGWEQIKEMCTNYQLDMQDLKTECFEQPIITEDYIASASHIMQAVATYLCMERMVSLQQQELPVKIDEYIQKNYTQKIDVQKLAHHFQIGKTQLYDIAKQSYGMGISSHIRNLRIGKAKQLLSERPELSLAEISSECGFNDYNYFITVFKRIVGIPPKEYSNSMKKY